MINTRKIALDALIEYERYGTYTNLALKKVLRNIESERDKRFISALIYGVIEKKLLLDFYISKVSSVKLKKINIVVLNILRLGLYQIIFMSTPESAACNTSVDLAKTNGQYKSAGFVNAILRKLSRTHKTIKLPDNKIERYSLIYSVSEDILKILVDTLGIDGVADFFENNSGSNDIYAAVNIKKCSSDELINKLKTESIYADTTDFNGLIRLSGAVDFEKSSSFKEGLFHIVGLPSYITALTASSFNAKTVIDMCAAPGGKTFVISYNHNDNDKIYAFDYHKHKVDNLLENCKRLGTRNVYPEVSDSTIYNQQLSATADVVLCDVPCSGLGVILKKPDIKYKKIDFDSIINTQLKILENAAEYVKKGGKLVYSTCTVNYGENHGVIESFLKKHSDFSFDEKKMIFDDIYSEYQFLPSEHLSEGFYVAVLTKNEEVLEN